MTEQWPFAVAVKVVVAFVVAGAAAESYVEVEIVAVTAAAVAAEIVAFVHAASCLKHEQPEPHLKQLFHSVMSNTPHMIIKR